MRKIPNPFGIDVTAARFLEYGSEDELRGLIAAGPVVAPWLHIGGGSNLLFIQDYEGTVLHSRIGGLEVTSEDEEHVSVRVGAGVVCDDFVAYCVEPVSYTHLSAFLSVRMYSKAGSNTDFTPHSCR